ncbi:hypothetical protein CC85DRAFT_301552 [Cutaneotrichosporon oleaginosum]|uniref:Uncharacterized protein n=1 Tax=Cutaneotrichosporon oleaginosum TaxID=879819 RepID=A0A0J0XQI8_9TREE|nr:uncharacterized protein CC85DRAFT_301552 [Cutaneotrichosporon oleaginosum]KLT43353.1 hypothetical protein CC85DRAFT_301552 [Cutaneotrichosporon oleaginosum]TXT14387.1 hypothetical protein COLE_00580 [Cutaneotrichosporon oleaginosum]
MPPTRPVSPEADFSPLTIWIAFFGVGLLIAALLFVTMLTARKYQEPESTPLMVHAHRRYLATAYTPRRTGPPPPPRTPHWTELPIPTIVIHSVETQEYQEITPVQDIRYLRIPVPEEPKPKRVWRPRRARPGRAVALTPAESILFAVWAKGRSPATVNRRWG